MTMKKSDSTPMKPLWRSLDELEQSARAAVARDNEFLSEDPTEIEVTRVGRRKFLGVMGASTALAGVSLPGCVRKPKERILPYAQRPEDLVPGEPRFFATTARIGGTVLGLLVESQDGRPTKIEGNPDHPMSLGATSAWAQAEVLGLYDPERTRTPLLNGKKSSWDKFEGFAREHFAGLEKGMGQGLWIVAREQDSPTRDALLQELVDRRFPKARVVLHDETAGQPPLVDFGKADVLLSVDADFLGSEGDAVRNARLFADRRRVEDAKNDTMNRLYAVEPAFTVTGGQADHRLCLPASQAGALLAAVAGALQKLGLDFAGAGDLVKAAAARAIKGQDRWVKAVAKDLLANKGKCAVVVGKRQPAHVQTLGDAINTALGAPVSRPRRAPGPFNATLAELAGDLGTRKVDTVLVLGANPAYDAPLELKFAHNLQKAKVVIHLGSHADETAALSRWHLPESHFLECWGDHLAADGTRSIQQPLIAPLFASRSEVELLGWLSTGKRVRGYELVRARFKALASADFEAAWRKWLHDGLVKERGDVNLADGAVDFGAQAKAWSAARAAPVPSKESLELNLQPCAKLLDGRYANNGWLQELPHPVSKLTWDNAAWLSPATAAALGLKEFDRIKLAAGKGAVELAVAIVPGTADNTVTVQLGYGRSAGGEVLLGAGANPANLRTVTAPYIVPGAKIERAGKRRTLLASTQDHWSMEGRPLARAGTLDQYRKDPEFADKMQEHPPLESIWTEPNEKGGHQWGMSIDLNACNGCNACVVACQAENNIPVVGKKRVLEGREMHWIRIDRYFEGDAADPGMVVQPMSCHHCALAPCESVCPVAATVHSPEGLNDMAYNRCIGTRYCANNCPYKVRRFNFFQFNGDIDPVSKLQKNPDVTVRFRGVMEKCTYCVQRINGAKIAAKRDGDGQVRDGAAEPACAQACPPKAITFGNLNDKESQVVRRKSEPRNYTLLSELNNKPRTTYLARLRNPNPELENRG